MQFLLKISHIKPAKQKLIGNKISHMSELREFEDLDVFISSHQIEFDKKRKRLEKRINNMPYLSCELLEKRGADSDNPEASSINAARRCDFYIGIFGKEFSSLTQKECIIALEQRKRNLIYVKLTREAARDSRVTDFIEKELKHRVKFHRFRSCKSLEDQIEKDLRRQILRILRTGLEVMAERKEVIGNKEQELRNSVYLSSSPSDNRETSSMIAKAKQKYESGDYFTALINTSTYIELLLRRVLTEVNGRDNSRIPFYALLREVSEHEYLSKDIIARLKDFWPVRNKALHEGLIPSKNDVKELIELANLLDQSLSFKLQNSPILTERDRRIIATRFMERLCELDLQARQNSLPNKFSINDIWKNNLEAFNQDIVGQYTVSFLKNYLKFIDQDSLGKISLTKDGSKHCGEEFLLPAGI
jgi:HEPN domain-containing protein